MSARGEAVAKVRPKTSTSSATSSGMFARSPEVWVAMNAPTIMTDDAAAVAAFDAWCPNGGDTRLRYAITGHLPMDPSRLPAMKAKWLRKIAAPRVLWQAGSLTPEEAAQIARWALWPRRAQRTMTLSAPDWISGPPPWESAE